MPELTVTLDSGETAPLRECEWSFFAKCGCPFGCMHATSILYTAYDEDTAFREFYDQGTKKATEQRIRKALADGVKAILMTKDQWRREVMPKMSLSYKCPHQPEQLMIGGES